MGRPRFVETLAYSNVWLSLTASGLAVATLFFCGERSLTEPLAVAVLLPALAMYVVYTYDKVARWDPFADAQNDPARSRFVLEFRRGLLVLGAIAALAGVVLAFRSAGGVRAVALFVAPFPIAVAYGTKVLPEGFRYRRLKDVPFGKSLSVAATWALTCVTLPLVALGKPVPALLHAALFVWCLGRFFVNTVFFDIGDVAGDIREGTRTLPVVFGAERTFRALVHTSIATAVVGVGAACLSPFVLPAAACAIVCGMYDVTYVRRGEEGEDLGFLCDIVADGTGIFSGFAAALLAFFAA